MNKLLQTRTQQYKKDFDKVLDKIEEYSKICIYRHHKPDYDALGCQMAMVEFIKTNWPDKDLIFIGDEHATLAETCFPKMMDVSDEWFTRKFLAIVLDTGDLDRLGDKPDRITYDKADYLIKIDHHPNLNPFGDICIVDDEMSAAAELLANFLLNSKYEVSQKCAEYLYKGLVGDSGRFLYESTTDHTFEVAKLLIQKGINITKIYSEMYSRSISDLEVTAWVLRHYEVTPHGVAYYIIDDATLQRFNLTPERGKDNVNMFAHLDGIHAWLSITEDTYNKEWRVSIRSGGKAIDKIANKYDGGGHAQASGVKLKSLDKLPDLLNDLDALFVDEK